LLTSKQKPRVVFQPEVHQALQRGIYQLVSAVRPTLGPVSGGVAIDHINKTKDLPEFLDDGGLIARRIIELPDRDEDMAAMLVRSMIVRQHELVGDGTTTAAVLLEAIFNEGLRYIVAGGNAMQLRRHLEGAIPLMLSALDEMVTPLQDQSALTNMACSLCHDHEMAVLLGEAFDLVGGYGRVEIREGYGRKLHLEYVEGVYYDTGLVSRAILPDDTATRIELTDPAFLICDFTIDNHSDLYPVLQTAFQSGIKELVIILRNLSEQGISLLATNNRMDKLKTIAVKVPGWNPTDRMAALEDLCILTGATPILKDTGETLTQITPAHFGKARRVWADLQAFGLVGGGGGPQQIREHINRLKQSYHQATDVQKRGDALTRIGMLLGGSVTLWVGGFSEPEINTRKGQAVRSARTLRAAVEEGVVPGGGIALMRIGQKLKARLAAAENTDERAAYRILCEALTAPARTIYRNAGYEPSEVLAQLQFEDDTMGFDVMSSRVVDVAAAGIWDSVAVLKASLRNAIHTAALALTIDSFVHMRRVPMVKNPDGTSD
jgi:chaperonin GroEL